jgi:phosphate-selective porin OprO and OprP
LGINGNIPYDFSYYAVMELSPFMSGNGSAYLLDAFITYNRFSWARVSMGSFKTPFGLETNTPCNGLITAYRSTATLQLVAPFRDFGLVAMGGNDTTLLSYQLGVMNGSGLGRLDNNQSKDIVGRVVFKPLHFLKVGEVSVMATHLTTTTMPREQLLVLSYKPNLPALPLWENTSWTKATTTAILAVDVQEI